MEEEKTVTLRPVLALHGYAVDFSQKPGKTTYRFCVKSGEVEIHHHGYDMIAGGWCLPPESGDDEMRILHTGEEAEITFNSSIHDYEPDCIVVANHHYGKSAVFSYRTGMRRHRWEPRCEFVIGKFPIHPLQISLCVL